MRILLLFFVGISLQLSAVTRAPLVLRACINNNDSTITLSWTSIADLCGSFSHYTIYGNENSGAFQEIANIPNMAIQQHTYSIPNLNADRSYFIRVFYLCDLADSATSNIIKVDINKPSTTQLDSVSFDVLTQNIIAGWRPNPAADKMGYRIYKQIGGINDSIGETSNTSYTVSTNPSNIFNVTLSVFDSCLLFSPISAPHRPALLSTVIDSCKGEIDLSWTRYQGWSSIDSQAVFINKNKSGFKHNSSLTGVDNILTFTDFVLGDTLCFLIRSYTSSGNISSSSNVVCIETRAHEIPSYLYLSQITVNDLDEIELDWTIDNVKDVRKFALERANKNSSLSPLSQINSSSSLNYSYTDQTADVNSLYYTYMLTCYNQCDEAVLSSNIGNSIHLALSPSAVFNSYINWDGGINEYSLEISEFSRSTWNTLETSASHGPFHNTDSAACYRIKAVENLNNYGMSSTSYSNVVCLEPTLRVFAPNAFRFTSENNRFIVVGTGIDHTSSSYEIYNRWGELVVQRPTDQAWYGDYKGERVLPGIYIYIVKVKGFKGESQSLKGVLRIIE